MYILTDLIKEFIELRVPADELAEMLTIAGLESEVIQRPDPLPESVVVGKVLSVEKHPNADRLSVCSVDTGDGEPLQIVCGAPNVTAGQTVPVAKVGTSLTPEFTIREAKIRGTVSRGMICAEDELGLSSDHSGIMVLDDGLPAGTQMRDLYSKPEVLEVELTPNRPDGFSHRGVVREISALTGRPYNFPEPRPQESGPAVEDMVKIEISDTDACPRYTGRVILNVKVAPSPDWLRVRIEAMGMRSINNVVDASNYVLMETGHPLHTFDYDKLRDRKIIVRKALEGELFTTLDHKDRKLSSDTLLICDGQGPVALAGIMGGLHSEVDDNTVNVLIESAYFDPATVRKGSKEQQLSTDASKRFERGCDPNETLVYAQNRLAVLIQELAGGEIASGMIDIYPEKIKAKSVSLRYAYLKKTAGMDVPVKTVHAIFSALGFTVLSNDEESVTVEVPTFRPDIEREIDLVEEVVRIYGYDKLPLLSHISMSVSEVWNPLFDFMDDLRDYFCGLGFNECVSNSLISSQQATAGIWGHGLTELSNPLSQEMSCLRSDLLQNLLTDFRYNATRKRQQLRLFEIGTVFAEDPSSETGVRETRNLAALVCAGVWDLTWNEEQKNADIFYLKGILDTLFRRFSLKNIQFTPESRKGYDLIYRITAGETDLGYLIRYPMELSEKYQVKHPVIAFEIDTEMLLKHFRAPKRYSEISPFPAVMRDISITVDSSVPADLLRRDILEHGGKNLIDIVIYDEYINSEKLGTGKRALSFRLKFQNNERTLADGDIDPVMEKLFKILYDNHGAQLR